MFPNDKIIEIFSMCDDFSKNFDDIIQKNSIDSRESTKKRKYHRDGTMSDAEVMTILVLLHGPGYRCLKHFYLDHVCKHMRYLFPKVVSYNRFVELQKRAVIKLAVFVKTILMGKCTGISFIDSTPLRVCRNQRILQHKTFKGIAQRGKCSMGWCHGFKPHFVCNDLGEIITFVLTGANVDDRDMRVWNMLAKRIYGRLFGDRGYISTKLFEFLFENGMHIVTGLRSNMKNRLMPLYDKVMLRKRYVIEIINDLFKNTADLVHSRHRSIHNFLMNLTSAMGAYCFFDNKPTAIRGFYLEHSKQLSIWE